jgi:hypothetical protein
MANLRDLYATEQQERAKHQDSKKKKRAMGLY